MEQNVLSKLSKGIPLAEICREEGMPHPTTWNDWCAADPVLNIAHGRARDLGFDAIAMDCLHIADETGKDTKFTETGEAADSEWIARSKLRVDTRLKLLAKWDPRRYGDKQEITHEAGDTLTSFLGGIRKGE